MARAIAAAVALLALVASAAAAGEGWYHAAAAPAGQPGLLALGAATSVWKAASRPLHKHAVPAGTSLQLAPGPRRPPLYRHMYTLHAWCDPCTPSLRSNIELCCRLRV